MINGMIQDSMFPICVEYPWEIPEKFSEISWKSLRIIGRILVEYW